MRGVLGTGTIVSGLVAFAFAANPVAAERILRGSLVALLLSLILGSLVAQQSGLWRIPSRQRVGLVALGVLTLLSRGAFLHPQAFYPDYRVHALVQQTLDHLGLSQFLDQLFEIQYARSLGLQQVGGNWYPFPYPPGSYLLTGGMAALFRLSPLDASMAASMTFASMIPVLTMAIGVRLRCSEAASLAAAFYVSLQPLLVRRMALGYFPGLAGQFMDALALLLLVAGLRPGALGLRGTLVTSAALLAAFLVYTQSIANFGLLIAALLVIEFTRPSPGGRRAALRAGAVGAIALAAATGIFYGRYLTVFENAANRRAQPEARVLDRLEELRRNSSVAAETPEADDLNDPWSGPTLNPARGFGRLSSRLWRFNGPFVVGIALGCWMLLRQANPATRNLLLSWAAVALWISLLAAGLPSPNGFQHLKDLEFVSPLIALAMGTFTVRLWEWRPVAGVLFASGWAIYAAVSFAGEWTARLLVFLDR
jgi:hypothetical protein